MSRCTGCGRTGSAASYRCPPARRCRGSCPTSSSSCSARSASPPTTPAPTCGSSTSAGSPNRSRRVPTSRRARRRGTASRSRPAGTRPGSPRTPTARRRRPRCGPCSAVELAELMDAIEGPITPSTFVGNLFKSVGFTRLAHPARPAGGGGRSSARDGELVEPIRCCGGGDVRRARRGRTAPEPRRVTGPAPTARDSRAGRRARSYGPRPTRSSRAGASRVCRRISRSGSSSWATPGRARSRSGCAPWASRSG